MSERTGSGVGAFLLGVALGAAVGMLFAPESGGEGGARGKVARGAKALREGALGTVDDLRGLLAAGADADAEDDGAPARSTREQLGDRLAEARRRRRGKGAAARVGWTEAAEEDEPVA